MTGFFKAASRPEREPSRPRFVNPRTGVEQSWQRASNYAAPLENPFGLKVHHGRQIVRGFNLRPDLARMALTGAIEGDKVDEVIATALTAAEDEAKANNGTAVHAALALCDTGREVPEEYMPHARAYVAELKRHGLRPVAVEQKILNTRLNGMGTFDRVYVTDSGRYLTGDIKTGSLGQPHGYGVQCEVYAGGDYVVHPDGSIEPIPWPLDQDTALLIHVDPDTGATSIYEVPLRVARWGAALAAQIRAFQRMDILLPYSGAPAGPLAEELRREAVQTDAATIADPQARGAVEAKHTIPFVGQVPGTSPAASESSPIAATASLSDAVLTSEEESQATKLGVDLNKPTPYVRRMLALMTTKNDKAKLQKMLHDLGGRDLNHHRRWLADAIIQAQDAASGPGTQQVQPSASTVAQTAEVCVPSAEATPFMLKQLSEAASINDLDRIRDNIIRQSGPLAWTQAMSDVAHARADELRRGDEAAAEVVAQTSPLSRIADAQNTQDLARVWEDVTSNGANMAAWTPAYDKAAREKATQLTAAQSAPSNPFGSQ